MNKRLFSVVLKDQQVIPFLLADTEQEQNFLNFEDFFFNNHNSKEKDYSRTQVHFNFSCLDLNYDPQINKIFIKEFGLFVNPKEVVAIKSNDIQLSGRYYLFAGETYYPNGGFSDLLYIHNNLSVLQEILNHGLYAAKFKIDWHHIVDIQTGKFVQVEVQDKDLLEEGYLDILGY